MFLAACGVLVVGVLVGSAAAFRTARGGVPSAASVDAAFQAIWTKYESQLRGLCMGAVDEGMARTHCFGSKAPGSSTPPDVHTLFDIASISKTFGATLLALRVKQGKVKLDDRVRKYVRTLPAKALYPKKLTLLDLADHRSGLPHGTPNAGSADDFILRTGRCLQNSNCRVGLPGLVYHYSSWAVSALGTLLALNDGFPDGPVGPWSADNAQAITDPLGMNETRSWQDWLRTDPGTFGAHRAQSGTEKFKNSPYESPGSGVWSSAHDMLIWLRYSMGLVDAGTLGDAVPLLYERAQVIRDTKNPPKQIGLVWTIIPGTGGTCISKAGDEHDFHAYLIFVDKRRRGVFLLVNKTPTTSYRRIATELLNSLPSASGAKAPWCPTDSRSGDDG